MYSVEDFSNEKISEHWLRGKVLTLEEVKRRGRTVIDHTFVDPTDEGPVLFYSDNHLFGYGVLPKHCVPCTVSLPFVVSPRPGFEEGYIGTPTELIRFEEYCEPKRRVLETVEALVEYLNSKIEN